jgi:hypothetical protein
MGERQNQNQGKPKEKKKKEMKEKKRRLDKRRCTMPQLTCLAARAAWVGVGAVAVHLQQTEVVDDADRRRRLQIRK